MNYLNLLNQEQLDAVNTVDGPLLVLAGAGSGKTRVVTYRIANLLEKGVPPSKILGVTFTNKAAGEMKERVNALTQSHVLICTFHSLGARILRESVAHLGYKNDFTIYDEEDVEKLISTCLDGIKVKDKKTDAKAFRNLISKAKNDLKHPQDFSNEPSLSPEEQAFSLVYDKYQTSLMQYNALDFDDLLFLTVRLFKEHPRELEKYQNRWDFLLIDEYQDTNRAQYEIVRLLVAKTQNICVVGDPDQSIYSWRGANVSNILNFENDFAGAKVVRLERNYRSRTNILEAANALIRYNFNRYEKNLWSDLGQGSKIKHFTGDSEQDEAHFVVEQMCHFHEEFGIPLKDMVVFYRTNFQSRAFEDRLLFKKVPYVIIGGMSFYQRKEIKDILAWLRIAHSGSDFISFVRTVNLPRRGLGETTVEKIRIGAMSSKLSLIEYCKRLVRNEPLLFETNLTAKQREGLADYTTIVSELKKISTECSLKELVTATIERSGYLKVLALDPETAEDRKGNVDELIAKAVEWELSRDEPSLIGFLEELSLKSSLDEASSLHDRVNLMTVHNGKGLEFSVVFLVGMEEDLFPHVNVRGSHEALEEERRLCYVGMTRAKEYLLLTEARSRFLWGTARMQRTSRFIKEIPGKYVESVKSRRAPKVYYRETASDHVVSVRDFGDEDIFSPGDAVFHKEFGLGVIQERFHGSVGLTYKILFSKDDEVRSIVAHLAQLKKI